jgi:dihydrofolate synthase/folylpolyglutamate synthase
VDACAALITSISLDHQSWLGEDRESIAAEKAGIFRPGAPAICADPDPPAAIGAHARRVGADLKQLGRDFEMRRNDGGWEWEASGIRFSLPGMHERGLQPDNIAGALMALVCLGGAINIDQEQILRGLSALSLRGRFEILPGRPQIILDVAHNPAAIRALRRGLRSHACSGRTLAVCGMLKDKAAKTMAAMLDPIVDEWRVGTIHDPRGRSAEDLGAEISASSGKPLFRHESVLSAFEAARRAADPADRILVFGSFHTVGDIIRVLEGEVQLS